MFANQPNLESPQKLPLGTGLGSRSTRSFESRLIKLHVVLFLGGLTLIVGCQSEPPSFSANELLRFRMERELDLQLTGIQSQLQTSLEVYFGTPDAPEWPACLTNDSRFNELTQLHSLDRAAGPVGRGMDEVEKGLFRKHCTQCHGITGDGLGPAAALLAPYPRDFRRGTFKFKSTPQGAKPTFEDLVRTLTTGVPGTSMPSMENLRHSKHYSDDVLILANYVRYLSIRGEAERRIFMGLVPTLDLENDEALWDASADLDANVSLLQKERIEKIIVQVAESWLASDQGFEASLSNENVQEADANSNRLVSTAAALEQTHEEIDQLDGLNGESRLASIERGRVLFHSELTSCSQCHGESGDGKGKLRDFDEWTKDWTIRAGVDPRVKEEWRPLKKLGLLKPVIVPPRNLQTGVFRSGAGADAIYRVIVHGIDGSPMPAAPLAADFGERGLNEDQIWDLVRYVESLATAITDRKIPATPPSHDG